MKVRELVDVTLASMPVKVDTTDNEFLVSVGWLFFNGECLIPNYVLEMEVNTISLFSDENEEDYGLHITVNH